MSSLFASALFLFGGIMESELLINISTEGMKCWKSEDGATGHVKALGVLFDDAGHVKDTDQEYFASDTYYGARQGDGMDASLNHRIPIVTADENANAELAKMAKMRFTYPVKAERVDLGIIGEHVLDLRNEYERWVYEQAEKGAFAWSTGTMVHFFERKPDGKITDWPIGEWAYTPTPAQPLNPQVLPVKSLSKLNFNLETSGKGGEETAPDVDGGETKNISRKEKEMSEQQEHAAVDLGPVLEAVQGIGDQVKAFGQRLEDVEKAQKPDNDPGVAGKNVAVVADADDWKYDNVDSADLAFMIGTLNDGKRSGQSRKGASLKAVQALAKRMDSDHVLKSDAGRVAAQAFKSAGFKANEINQSILANYGDEWVGVFYSGAIWEAIRHEAQVLSRIPSMEVPAGAESVVIPLESADPTWYKVAQAASLSSNPGGIPTNTVTASNLGTDNQTMTLAKMGARVLWTGELEEDSVLPYVAQLRQQLAVSGAEHLESAIIDGDSATGATTNINDIGGTPGGTEYWLTVNGFRKLALVTNTANSRDAGGLTSADFLETIKLMGVSGSNADQMRTAFIIPWAVQYKALELADVKTRDVFAAATLENGRLNAIYGYPILTSHHMHKAQASRLANAAGKIDLDTAGNNTTSAILAVRFDQWMMGYRRRMTLETTRVPAADSTEIVALMRFGLVNRDNEASAISYNVTV
jgi:hypothetical protein